MWWDAIRAESRGPTVDLGTLAKLEPEVSVGAAWLLAAAARHCERQRWVADIVTRLGVPPEDLARRGSGAHPEISAGNVPSDPGWTYRFHGRGCAFTHEARGEYLDVDFLDATPRWIDASFFEAWLRSATRDYGDERFLQMSGSYQGMLAGADELCERSLALRDGNCFRLDGAAEDARPALAALADRASDPANRLRIALLLGDDGLALSEAERTGETALVPALRARFLRIGR